MASNQIALFVIAIIQIMLPFCCHSGHSWRKSLGMTGLFPGCNHSHSVLNISSPIKMSVIGILYGGYSFRYQSDFARKTFLCTRRVPQNQVSHSYQYLLATEEQPCFSIGYMNIIFTAKTIIDGNFVLKEPVQIFYCLLPERCSSIWFCTAFPVSRRKQPCQSIN